MADTLLNEVMYNEVLTSDGYVVDFAVCTTYSLDMPMLLSVPFMLGTMSELSDEKLYKLLIVCWKQSIRHQGSLPYFATQAIL